MAMPNTIKNGTEKERYHERNKKKCLEKGKSKERLRKITYDRTKGISDEGKLRKENMQFKKRIKN